jgi:hypothetical protein
MFAFFDLFQIFACASFLMVTGDKRCARQQRNVSDDFVNMEKLRACGCRE